MLSLSVCFIWLNINRILGNRLHILNVTKLCLHNSPPHNSCGAEECKEVGFPHQVGLPLLKNWSSIGSICPKGKESSVPGKTMSARPSSKALGMGSQDPEASQQGLLSHRRMATNIPLSRSLLPLLVKGLKRGCPLLVLSLLIQNWGHCNRPLLPSEVTWKFCSWESVWDTALVCLYCCCYSRTCGNFSYVQRGMKSFVTLSFTCDSLPYIMCPNSKFSSWNWEPRMDSSLV